MKTNKKNILMAAGVLILGIFLGWAFFGGSPDVEPEHDHNLAEENRVWTCSMHPQIRQPEPGKCPICGMDLIPVSDDQTSMDSDMFQMSEQAMKLANVRTMTVGSGEASKKLRLNGKVVVDERNSYTQSTHIPGRIEQLRVNFTGEKVNKGEVLASVFSPSIVTAQEELLQAQEIKESQPELFEAAKQKLRNWKISEAQIENMLNRGEPVQRFPITADVSGVVTELMAEQGDYLERGMPIYKIANLNQVWIQFDLYESDLSWVEEGSTVEYTVQSLPGESFLGEITFIDPLLNTSTRVATARIEVNNSNEKLKPGMFVSGIVEDQLEQEGSENLVVPKSAVLWTGERSVVYVKEDLVNGAGFKMREIGLGPSLGDSYVVQSGLLEGEEIVINGTFSVDAAVQLAGKPSMMNPETDTEIVLLSDPEKEVLLPVFNNYLEVKNALVNDDFNRARTAAKKLNVSLNQLPEEGLTQEVSKEWKNRKQELQEAAGNMAVASDIKEFRTRFDKVSKVMIAVAQRINPMSSIFILHCPMANSNNGASWLSLSSEIENPYYGEAMLSCGSVTDSLN